MLNKLFPYKLHLQIFQQDEYSSTKFFQWITFHFFIRTIENKKPLVWTQKAKMLYYLSILLSMLCILVLIYFYKLFGFIIGIVLATQSYLFLLIAFYLLQPFEKYQKREIKKATKQKLASFPKLKIIGITGSYGKTSVKEFLYQILKTEHRVLKTPESYNTPYGIAKVVDLELDDSYEYFICEMGAYRVGDIKEICDMVQPDYGILTGINTQHLETFGSIENTTKGKFELIDSLPNNGIGLINIDNPYIRSNYQNYKKRLITYGFNDDVFSIKDMNHHSNGTDFTLTLEGKKYHVHTELLGKPNIENILAAATMSRLLGMKPQTIVTAITKLTPVPHRLEIKKVHSLLTVIDDAYNSNVNGFKEAVELLSHFKEQKILITPGIVDLGNQTFSIHKKLGETLEEIDRVILVGKSERTHGLKEGIRDKGKIEEVETLKAAWEKVNHLNLDHPVVVLLENDLPDNY